MVTDSQLTPGRQITVKAGRFILGSDGRSVYQPDRYTATVLELTGDGDLFVALSPSSKGVISREDVLEVLS